MKKKLADRIILLRKQAGLIQVELADKIGVSKSQYIHYDTKEMQPPASIINKFSDALGTSVDFLISGDKNEKAKASLKNSELIQRSKEDYSLSEDEQGVLIKIISASVRDFKAKQAYASYSVSIKLLQAKTPSSQIKY